MHVIYSTLIQELHSFAKSKQYEKAVIGLSGGLDSAVALCVAVRAFGAKNVSTLSLPEVGLTPQEDIERAKLLSEFFGCETFYQPINNFLVDFHFVPWPQTEEASLNVKARMRATLIEQFADATGAMILGTANKSDLCLGFGQKNGAFIGDLHLLGDLYKTDLMDLARTIGLPEELISNPSARQLKYKVTDEMELGGPWNKIDDILRQLEDKVDPDTMIEKGMDALLVHKLVRLLHENQDLARGIPVVHIGRITDSIKKAQKAEAESLG